jgi:signal transduction histidine kinase
MSVTDEDPQTPAAASSEQKAVFSPDPAKLEALAEFAAGAGHEINNPLATIIGRAQLLLKDERDPQRRQMLMSIGAQAYRIRDMIGDTMLFGRPPLPEFKTVNLRDVFDGIVKKQDEELANEGCSVTKNVPETILLRADPVQLSIVLSELLRNSRKALSPNGGEIQIAARQESDQAIIEMIDHGPGFTDLERQHAFDPFFSGRQAGRGLGFGLSKCWRIVDQHAGSIEIQSAPDGPTTARIAWPIA